MHIANLFTKGTSFKDFFFISNSNVCDIPLGGIPLPFQKCPSLSPPPIKPAPLYASFHIPHPFSVHEPLTSISQSANGLSPRYRHRPVSLGLFSDISVSCTEVILRSPAVIRKCGFTEDRSYTTRLLHSSSSLACWWLLPVGSVLFASCRVTPSLTGSDSDLFSFSADFINCGVGYSKRGEWGGAPRHTVSGCSTTHSWETLP